MNTEKLESKIEKALELETLKKDVPEELDLSKEFYDKVHDICSNNIIVIDKIIELIEEAMILDDKSNPILSELLQNIKEQENSDRTHNLDVMICVDKIFKKFQSKLASGKYDNVKSDKLLLLLNPNILDIDIV